MRIIKHQCQDYAASLQEQDAEVAAILADRAQPCLIFTEHPPMYSLGTSAKSADVLQRCVDGQSIAVYASGRGGEVTYHGPGQRLCYVLADLRQQRDLHKHVWRLEELIIRTLADFSLSAQRSSRGIGVWVDGKKIAAIGVRCRRWISMHGVALNQNPNLKHFSGIVPCGMRDAPVTSMQACGLEVSRQELEQCMQDHALSLFSPKG